ncbi:hypothetical protein DY000_02058466 [Brassica cretica]|uniref:DUF4283 domain-containing protein n=1 Tax=Brassica cretica TaxID=69181 RepID=A0ABQ7ANA8_BRACR|nr:hypothetical protein DY000_02058466 [Brassica cretica]
MLGGGVASSGFSNVRIATVISKRIFPSVVLVFGPHEIMSTLFFGAGGGELGDSCSVSLPLLSSLWGSILTGQRRSCLRACSVELSNPTWWKVLVADGVRFLGMKWFDGGIRVLGSPCLSIDPFWNWIGVLLGRWSPRPDRALGISGVPNRPVLWGFDVTLNGSRGV